MSPNALQLHISKRIAKHTKHVTMMSAPCANERDATQSRHICEIRNEIIVLNLILIPVDYARFCVCLLACSLVLCTAYQMCVRVFNAVEIVLLCFATLPQLCKRTSDQNDNGFSLHAILIVKQ